MQSIYNTPEYFMVFALREGVVILVFLQLLSLSKIKNKKGNLLMSSFFMVLAIVLLNDNAFLHVIGIHNTSLINRILFIPNLILPTLFYFSILYYVNPVRRWGRKDIYFILPWLIHLLLIIPFLVNPEIKHSSHAWYNYAQFYKYFTESLFTLFIIVLLFMLLALLNKHRQQIKVVYSNPEGVDLNWLRNFVFLVPILILSYVFVAIFDNLFINSIGDFLLIGVLFYMGYHLVAQKEIYSYSLPDQLEEKPALPTEAHSQKKLLSDEQMEIFATSLEAIMVMHKPYLDPNLNLHQLSMQVELRKQELSYLLNNYFKLNFFTYINNYRIEESKNILKDPQKSHLNMVGVANESGYKSKSTFYTRFREATSLSPTEYVKSQE